MIYSAIVFLPGLAGLFVGLFGRALGPRPSEIITTGALLVSCVLSWIVFWRVGFGHETAHVAIERWITSGRARHLLGLPHRHADGGDVRRRHDGIRARARLLHRLHARGSLAAALLRLPVGLHLRHADAGDGRQPRADVLRLGGRRPLLLPADRVLVRPPAANAAAIKAFVVNRVGDFGFALGIFGIFAVFRTVEPAADVRRRALRSPGRRSCSSATRSTS